MKRWEEVRQQQIKALREEAVRLQKERESRVVKERSMLASQMEAVEKHINKVYTEYETPRYSVGGEVGILSMDKGALEVVTQSQHSSALTTRRASAECAANQPAAVQHHSNRGDQVARSKSPKLKPQQVTFGSVQEVSLQLKEPVTTFVKLDLKETSQSLADHLHHTITNIKLEI